VTQTAERATVPELRFAVSEVAALAHVAVPTLAFRLRIAAGAAVRSLTLNVQLRIDARGRPYEPAEQARLTDLFGEPERWGETMRSLLWTHATLVVPPFSGETEAELAVPCTYDFDVAASKYLDALAGGEVPLELLFSGTLFYAGPDGRLQAAHVPWDREAACRMPVAVWREAMERAFPGTAWVRLGRGAFGRLHAYRSARALPSWDAALEELLKDADDD
jgi:hypothetical protein